MWLMARPTSFKERWWDVPGHYFETLVTPSVTTRWSFIFTVFSYTSTPSDLC
jgi:hypothetical protein